MADEVILKKLEQIETLVAELEKLLRTPFEEFTRDFMMVRTAERNFQLVVDLATDCNTSLLLERGYPVPESYRQSFLDLPSAELLPGHLAETLSKSAMLRNILVHEYDFEEDYKKFYSSVKMFIPAYREYVKEIYRALGKRR